MGLHFQQADLNVSRVAAFANSVLHTALCTSASPHAARICTGLKRPLMLQDVVLVRPHMRWPTEPPSSCHGPAMNGHAGGLAAGTPVKPGVQPSSAAATHPRGGGSAEDRATHLAKGTADSHSSSDASSPAAGRQPARAQEQSGFGLFCVFDGHNGRRCAAHMEELICGVRPARSHPGKAQGASSTNEHAHTATALRLHRCVGGYTRSPAVHLPACASAWLQVLQRLHAHPIDTQDCTAVN